MTSSKVKNLPASVRARLLNLARERGEDFTGLLTRYVLERFMFRLASSEYADRFVLKGATLFAIWSDQPHRPTRDIDLLGFGVNDVPALVEVFGQVCQQDVEPDGLVFAADSVQGGLIREDRIYEGVRVTLMEETVVAEKLQAMVALGIVNSRMKDFYDIWVLARDNAFEGSVLSEAVRRTFARRRSPLQSRPPVALTLEFSDDPAKAVQWRAFLRRGRLVAGEPGLHEVVQLLAGFLLPMLGLSESGASVHQQWPPGGPWRSVPGR